ncbi:MAG: hypothetical protein QOF73_896 [Thermomicrobiales bacterium]|jgi:hypothetical protein|nr:hypothetical protein [Thermomicrobiales bacterium]
MHRVSIVAIVLVVALSWWAPVAAQDASPAASQSESGELDLGVIALLPSDFDDPGAGLYGGHFFTAETYPAFLESIGVDVPDLQDRYDDAGLRRYYDHYVVLPSADDPTYTAVQVQTFVEEYETPEGADAGLDIAVEDFSNEPDLRVADNPPAVGERALLVSGEGVYEEAQEGYSWIQLQFVSGNLNLGVIWNNYWLLDTAGTPTAAPPAPDADEVAALAQTLLDRVDQARGATAPGLSNQVLRLSGDDVSQYYDEYRQLDGELIPFFNETPEGTADRQASYLDAPDVYAVTSDAGAADSPVRYSSTLRRFSSAEDAQAFPAGFGDYLAQALNVSTVEQLADAPTVGDSSVTYAYDFTVGETTSRAIVVAATVGDVGFTVLLRGATQPDLDALADLAGAQVDCLDDAQGMCEPIATPAGLTISASPEADA